MPRKAMEILTESMFYVLMAFSVRPMCGTDAAAWIDGRTGGRMKIGPATLYTILAKFESSRYIREIEVEGRKRTYCITPKGEAAYREEVERLQLCLHDAQAAKEELL